MDITEVEVIQNHVVRLRFADGTIKTIDLDPYLHGPVFDAIRTDPATFAAVRVDPDAGTIVWPNGADLAPDTLYTGRSSARMESQGQTADETPQRGKGRDGTGPRRPGDVHRRADGERP